MSEFDTVNVLILLMLIMNASALIILFLLIFPIIFRARLAIEKILVLFTKISKLDSEHYLSHYKLLRYRWNGMSNDLGRLQKEQWDSAKQQDNRDKKKQASSISRSKLYKGLQSQHFVFLCAAIIFVSIVIMILLIRTVTHLVTIDKLKSHGSFNNVFAGFPYQVSKVYIKYRDVLNSIITNQPNLQTINTDYNNLLSQFDSIPVLLEIALNPEKVYLSQYSQNQIEQFFFVDSCSSFVLYPTDVPLCKDLIKGLLLRGYQSFFDDAKAYIELRSTYLTENLNGNQAALHTSASTLANDDFIRDVRWGLTYTREGFAILDKTIRTDLTTLNSDQESNNTITIAIYFVLLILFLAIIWRKQYNQLKDQVFKTNYFFTLIPYQLIKENQHIRVYLQRNLSVKSLNNTI
jgi:hypothetical protein